MAHTYLHLVDFMVLPVNIHNIDPMGGATPETSTGFELTYSNKQKYRHLAKIKGILAAPPKLPPSSKGLIRPYYRKQLVNKPLIRPYFLGGVALGGYLIHPMKRFLLLVVRMIQVTCFFECISIQKGKMFGLKIYIYIHRCFNPMFFFQPSIQNGKLHLEYIQTSNFA